MEELVLRLERELAGVRPSGRCGVLFDGTAGSGKTWLLHGLKDKLQEGAVYVDCSRLLERYVGDLQRSILAMFEDSRGQQNKVLLWDNIDSLFLDGDGGPVPSFSSLAFLSCLEDLAEGQFIVATCTSAASLPLGITLSHHLGAPRALLPPSAPERSDMFHTLLSDSRLSLELQAAEPGDASESLQDVCDELSLRTQGFSASDVLQLVRACIYDSLAEHLHSDGLVPVRVGALFQQAAAIQPSAAQGIGAPSRAARPAVLVGLEVEQARLLSLLPHSLSSPTSAPSPSRLCRGILIHGPSGCGKSSLANWLAFSVRHRFRLVTVSCAELVHKLVGESERRIAACFKAGGFRIRVSLFFLLANDAPLPPPSLAPFLYLSATPPIASHAPQQPAPWPRACCCSTTSRSCSAGTSEAARAGAAGPGDSAPRTPRWTVSCLLCWWRLTVWARRVGRGAAAAGPW